MRSLCGKFAERRDYLVGVVRFPEEQCALRQIRVGDEVTGYNHELDRRQHVADGSGKFYPVHRARHPAVGGYDRDVFVVAELEHQTAVDTTTGRPAPLGKRAARMADTVG